jgi:phage tail sheath protein FI
MPNLTYPGVYVEEVPSGVRTITGVSKSTTAFIGRALQGLVDEPVTLHSFADFEREHGGLWTRSHLGFSVRDFFAQGGSTAIVVRVAKGAAPAQFSFGNPTDNDAAKFVRIKAGSPGAWGNRLAVRVSSDGYDAASGLFDVFVYRLPAPAQASAANGDNQPTAAQGLDQLEVIRRVSLDRNAANRIDRVFQNSSRYLTATYPATIDATAAGKFGPNKNVWRVLGTDGQNVTSTEVKGAQATKTGIYALDKADVVNLLVIPPFLEGGADDGTEITGRVGDATVPTSVVTEALKYAKSKRAVLLLDSTWTTPAAAKAGAGALGSDPNSALFFPRITQENPLLKVVEPFAPAGAVAGVIARIDTADTGVSRASAGLEAGFGPGIALDVGLTDPEIGDLNQLGINCLRNAPAAGPVVWGARTREGADTLASEWKYLPVRRTALYIEESVSRAIQWAVFAPNDEGLWAQLRLNIGSFMDDLFRKRWFQGASARDAYFVRCDSSTTTQQDIDLGIVNVLVGFAPLKPAEFVVLRLQQIAGANL